MSSSSSSLARSLLGVVVEVAALSISGAIAMSLASRLLHPRRAQRSAPSRGHKLAIRSLKGKQQPLNDHEAEVASDVVCPTDVGCSFADVGGLQKLAEELRQAILLPLQNAHLFERSKLLRPPKGILLHGPPGTGKTMLAKAIAREAKFAFITLNPARLCSKWYGESNKFAEAYFSLAHKLAPCVLFIDEIDCLFAGGSSEHEATAMLRSQFLTLWDGLLSPSAASTPVVVIAATNRPNHVDPAILRRLPLAFTVEMPSCEARADILRTLLAGEPLADDLLADEAGALVESAAAARPGGVSLLEGGSLPKGGTLSNGAASVTGAPSALLRLARATEGYSGSDLEQLCRSAMLKPLQDMIQGDALRGDALLQGGASEGDRQPAAGAVGEDTVAGGLAPTAMEGGDSQAPGKGERPPPIEGGVSPFDDGADGMAAGIERGEADVEVGNGVGSVLSMRQLTLLDFKEAMARVRPSRNRFNGASPHFDSGMLDGDGSAHGDADLYD